jgi:serpin B
MRAVRFVGFFWVAALIGTLNTGASDEASASFALELYEQVRETEGNLCVSPYGLSSALAMTLAGARERTAEQIADVLQIEAGNDGGVPARALEEGERQLWLATGLWAQTGIDLRAEYVSELQSRFRAGYSPLDFNNGPEQARESINAWAARHTGGRISALLAEGQLDSDTVLVLTSAVYFEGRWSLPFDATRTIEGEFLLGGGRAVEVPFMSQTGSFRLGRADRVDLIELPYGGGRFSMVVLLPSNAEGLSRLEESLDVDHLSSWMDTLADAIVRLRLPRFGVASRLDLIEPLRSMGMTDAFDGRADFSGITDGERLFVSAVVQNARIDVDERGTEGSSTDGVVIKKGPPPDEFVVDRPFIFLVRDRSTGGIVFIGRIANPALPRVVG